MHRCVLKCHKDKCGICLETVEKQCRCGQHIKEVQCSKPFFCETKCKNLRDCNKHPCNKKCCDGNCPTCEKPCGKTLSCGNHKCASVCHRGPCYPCNLTEFVTCFCGETKLTVPCGRKYKVKPPKCNLPCKHPPDCHHEKRESHRCHFGNCPPCKQICNRTRENCNHPCPNTCHDAVMVKIETAKASAPWEEVKPQKQKKCLPCLDCTVPVPVQCLGFHEISNWPCHLAKPGSCFRPCGRLLQCQNHKCTLPCHLVEDSPNDIQAGSNCEICESECTKERPEGCQHQCLKPCHPGKCPPCKQMLRIKCHCGMLQPYVVCNEFLNPLKQPDIQSCGNQCPKNYDCGHRCRADCHPGPCPDAELCKKKVKIFCKCKRIKKEFSCDLVRNNKALVDCDMVCTKLKEETNKKNKAIQEERKKLEELKNKQELEKYIKKFEGKKKQRDKKYQSEDKNESFLKRYYLPLSTVIIISLMAFTFLSY
ncbi:hypothetical protein WA026_020594 [Henosepilachna vigintioctopunctata]|uniref:NF-X1-type domain-containing protein n=1 Tax=Henosepilachna vigintioctopunctata TaxID=420089 RepID=A0AAW1V4D6_9CUCU